MTTPLPRFAAIVVAAGSGFRFGGPKQWRDLGGKPVIRWSVEALIEAGADLLLKFVPPEWGGGKPQSRNPLDDPARAAERLMTPATKGAASGEKSGYDTRERREMDRLFQSRD